MLLHVESPREFSILSCAYADYIRTNKIKKKNVNKKMIIEI